MHSRRGAQPVFEPDATASARRSESAPCPSCKSPMQIETDGDGRAIERCSSPAWTGCPNQRWHHPRVDPAILLPPDDPAKARRSHAKTSSASDARGAERHDADA